MMAAVRSVNTKPELTLRRLLFRRGLRYRLHDRRLVGRPDLSFPGSRVAVFVDGDFWHGHGWRERGLTSFEEQFPTNRDFWANKIRRNMARDSEVNDQLRGQGWTVLRFLASQVESNAEAVADEVQHAVWHGRPPVAPDGGIRR